jgi:uncharacterized protein YdeI (BOF family)
MYTVYTRILILLTAAVLLAACDTGSAPSDLGDNTTVAFATADSTVTEGDVDEISFSVTVQDAGFKPFSVELVRITSSTLSDQDVDAPETTTIDFPQSTTTGETRDFVIELSDDMVHNEGTETLTYELANADGVALGDQATFTLSVEDNEDPFDTSNAISISDAREQSGTVTIVGVVTRKEGSNTFVQDDSGATGASGLIVRADTLSDAYDDGDIQPGDRIAVTGERGAFRGIEQISSNVSFVQVPRETGDLPAPQVIEIADLDNNGGEFYESEYVRVTGVTINADGDTEFGSNANYDVTDGTGTTTMRITDDSFYAGEPIPEGTVTITAPLGQFSFSGDGGYQLLPLIEGDIQ